MATERRVFRSRPVRALLALVALTAACNGDSTDLEITEAFVGNWFATSFIVDGEELIGPESNFSLSFGFFEDGSYQMIVGGDDNLFLCSLATSCVEDGDFSFSGNVITLDPGTADALNLQWSVSANTLTVSGTLDGSPFQAVFERT